MAGEKDSDCGQFFIINENIKLNFFRDDNARNVLPSHCSADNFVDNVLNYENLNNDGNLFFTGNIDNSFNVLQDTDVFKGDRDFLNSDHSVYVCNRFDVLNNENINNDGNLFFINDTPEHNVIDDSVLKYDNVFKVFDYNRNNDGNSFFTDDTPVLNNDDTETVFNDRDYNRDIVNSNVFNIDTSEVSVLRNDVSLNNDGNLVFTNDTPEHNVSDDSVLNYDNVFLCW